MVTVEEVKEWLKDFDVIVEQEGNIITAKSRGYIARKEDFAKLAQACREHGGVYVPGGKLTHWRFGGDIAAPSQPQGVNQQAVLEALDLLEKAVAKLKQVTT